jgi:hypothetical protein
MSLISTSAGLQRQVLTPITALTPKASVPNSDKVTMPKLLDCVASARRSYNRKHIVSTNLHTPEVLGYRIPELKICNTLGALVRRCWHGRVTDKLTFLKPGFCKD